MAADLIKEGPLVKLPSSGGFGRRKQRLFRLTSRTLSYSAEVSVSQGVWIRLLVQLEKWKMKEATDWFPFHPATCPVFCRKAAVFFLSSGVFSVSAIWRENWHQRSDSAGQHRESWKSAVWKDKEPDGLWVLSKSNYG